MLAMTEGTYLVASTPSVAPATVEVKSGVVSEMPLTLIDWADRAVEPAPAVLMTEAPAVSLPEGGAGRYVLFGSKPTSIGPDEVSARELAVTPGRHGLLWRLSIQLQMRLVYQLVFECSHRVSASVRTCGC